MKMKDTLLWLFAFVGLSRSLHHQHHQQHNSTSSSSSSASSSVWSEWSKPSACSRSCGGGVAHQTRTCLSGKCSGAKKIYTSCNIQACPEASLDFRVHQCAQYDQVAFAGKLYDWVPYYGPGVKNKCALNCLAKGEQFFYRHAAKVVDGTRCDADSLDVCVDGKCMAVGCDSILGSGTELDHCGVCGGNGGSCRRIHGIFKQDPLKTGYHDVVLIPAGASHISVKDVKSGKNFLAMRDVKGEYLLNGHWQIKQSHKFHAAGSKFFYQRAGHVQTIEAQGPTNKPLFIVLLYQGTNHGVKYEYSVPLTVSDAAGGRYEWQEGAWQACSQSCGHGTQSRKLTCVRSEDSQAVSDDLCDLLQKPRESQECSHKACPARWTAGEWLECSTSCGAGVQFRHVSCQQVHKNGMLYPVDAKHCAANEKPDTSRPCNEDKSCPAWQTGEWTPCSVYCGSGRQSRRVICRSPHRLPGATSDILPDKFCSGSKPAESQVCSKGPCEGVEWVVSEWSGCDGSCSSSVETRDVVCSSKSGRLFDDEHCGAERPAASRACEPDASKCPEMQWHATQWTECSSVCGSGMQYRQVICMSHNDGDTYQRVEDEHCDPTKKMATEQHCKGSRCDGWFTGPWAKCDSPCGGGQQKREVICFSAGQAAAHSQCDTNSRPQHQQDCNSEPCDEDNLLPVGGCKTSRHGCCPDGITKADGPDYLGCPSRDRIPTGSCIESYYGCCPDDVTAKLGPFNQGCPKSTCKHSRFGCCPDGIHAAGGRSGEGCPARYGCSDWAFGCCPDLKTPANGPKDLGCPELGCQSVYGCCPDNFTPASGRAGEGCPDDQSSGAVCEDSLYGCCDNGSPASGPNKEGCNDVTLSGCEGSEFGCCPDNKRAASGPDYAGCGVGVPDSGTQGDSCKNSEHGCCPDGETPASGPDQQGCEVKVIIGGCAGTEHGCCEDGVSVAAGPDGIGCENDEEDNKVVITGCAASQFGCCPGASEKAAEGPNYAGCDLDTGDVSCDRTTHGCCPDGVTVATGEDFAGCQDVDATHALSCDHVGYGCCPDGETPAMGPNFAGCKHLVVKSGECGRKNEMGPCRQFTVLWYFDVALGQCNRFWYGGCKGNGNRFGSQEECQKTCVKPEGLARCYLPQVTGPCRGNKPRWFYNPGTRSCESFSYGGCKGNNNNFESQEECENRCMETQKPDICQQPQMVGPCRGRFSRFYYDSTSKECKQFYYGGCRGNDNKFETQDQCEQKCHLNASQICVMKKDQGTCDADYKRWYFNTQTSECESFVYGGCGGNANRFSSQSDCHQFCRDAVIQKKEEDLCSMPRDKGSCDKQLIRWYFDKSTNLCKQFTYGGCDGNPNRFDSEAACRQRCNATEPSNVCLLGKESGPCKAAIVRWYYSVGDAACRQFYYGGCDGNGNNFGSSEECSKHCTAKVEPVDKCHMAAQPGPCLSKITRYYYDKEEGKCREFIYGGCQGNKNRFLTLEHCQNECEPLITTTVAPSNNETIVTENICALPRADGDCHEYERSWYYDSVARRCQPFIYRGCGGNKNRFSSQDKCEYQCTRKQVPAREPVTGLSICALPSDSGPCRNKPQRKWYYDRELGQCKEFLYSGCDGNENRFDDKEACETACPVRELCKLEHKTGRCRASKTRWFFDTSVGKCQEFTYGGCDGNANRFLTAERCDATCLAVFTPVYTQDMCEQPRDPGPCRARVPSYYYDHQQGRCVQFMYGGCLGNRNRFSHIGECEELCMTPFVMETTTLPDTTTRMTTTNAASASVCEQQIDAGPCRGSFVVWYYDSESGTCGRFRYGGCGGNGNRFNTSQECRDACISSKSTVALTTVQVTTTTTTPVYTSLAPWTQTPTGTTTEVIAFDLCAEVRDPGPCRGRLARWYYNPNDGSCHHFFYGGCRGNANRFDSQEECQNVCAATSKTVSPVCSLSRDVGPCKAQISRWYYDTNSSTCQRFMYGGCQGNENRFETEEQCTATCGDYSATSLETKIQDLCHLPRDQGPCRAEIQRWYFDKSDGTCKDFIYGGCQGNSNNFESIEECRASCSSVDISDICRLPQAVGPCRASLPRWHFDQSVGRCVQFMFGGCHGNKNKFMTLEECQQTCNGETEVATTTPVYQDICKLPKTTGPCEADILRFYFDHGVGRCRPFSYGGCQGNKNNFESEKECSTACVDQQTVIEEPRRPGDCFAPVDVGSCKALVPRWYYHHGAGCVEFNYGGCGGNRNNFLAYEDCTAYCSKVALNCGVLTCNLDCPYGYTRGEDGCQECHCHDPCEDVACSAGEECVVWTIYCIRAPCPRPTGVCKPRLTTTTTARATCDQSLYGCCPDGVTAAQDYNFRGCPEQRPSILSTDDESVKAGLGQLDLLLNCQAIGAPAPQLSWYKDGVPVEELDEGNRLVTLGDGTLQIRSVQLKDAAAFTCKAYNGIGEAATKIYQLQVQVVPQIVSSSSAASVKVAPGYAATLECEATGLPEPTVEWLFNGVKVPDNDLRRSITQENSLVIGEVQESDYGSYVCEAVNEVGSDRSEVMLLGPLTVSIAAHDTNFEIGGDFELSCLAEGDTRNMQITWMKDGEPLPDFSRYTVAGGSLKVQKAVGYDAGNYSCVATREKVEDLVMATTQMQVNEMKIPDDCINYPQYANCDLIVLAGYCRHSIYSEFCCRRCHEAGKLP